MEDAAAEIKKTGSQFDLKWSGCLREGAAKQTPRPSCRSPMFSLFTRRKHCAIFKNIEVKGQTSNRTGIDGG